MFNTTNGCYSLADIAAATGNNKDGFLGGDGALWIIILFLFCFAGGWGNGNGLFGGGNATASGITDGYILTSDFASLERQMDNGFDGIRQQGVQIANGISSLGYDQLSQMNGINTNIYTSSNNITNAINNGINTLSAQANANEANRQQCCCSMSNLINTSFADLNYNLASQSCQTRQTINDSTRDIVDGQNASTQAILNAISQMESNAKDEKIASLTSQLTAMQNAADNAAQTNAIINQLRVPTPIPAYTVPSPFVSAYGCGCNCSVG